jgi:glutathione S-transferase
MKLYQFAYSPFAAKVRKCLELKGVDYTVVEVPYLDRRALLAVAGDVQVPVLVDGQSVVNDSPRITAYLDERYSPTLRPGPLTGTAVVYEQWADQLLEDVAFRLAAPLIEERMAELNGGREDAPALFRLVKERKYGVGCIDAWTAQEGELEAKLQTMLAPLAHTLSEQPFLLGDHPTLADAAVWGQLYMIEAVKPGRTVVFAPGLGAWYRRVSDARK